MLVLYWCPTACKGSIASWFTPLRTFASPSTVHNSSRSSPSACSLMYLNLLRVLGLFSVSRCKHCIVRSPPQATRHFSPRSRASHLAHSSAEGYTCVQLALKRLLASSSHPRTLFSSIRASVHSNLVLFSLTHGHGAAYYHSRAHFFDCWWAIHSRWEWSQCLASHRSTVHWRQEMTLGKCCHHLIRSIVALCCFREVTSQRKW